VPLRLGNPARRINIGLAGMAVVLSLFAGRLVQLQGLDSKVFAAKAASLRVREETLPARRGPITDVKGHELAVTVEARQISADPAKVPAGERDAVAGQLAGVLGVPKEGIAEKLARTGTRYTLLARNVPLGTASRVLELDIDGVVATPHYERLYPGGDLAGGLIGFVGDDGDGLTGVEQTYDDLLAGKDGRQTIEIGGTGQRIPMTRSTRQEPVAGQGVRLTIDRDIQWAAQEAIAEQVREVGAQSGSVIVMDVRTGQVLAMANAPEVDLGAWRSLPPAGWANRAVSEVFEPGSTGKVITAAAALQAGVVRPETVFEVKDKYRCADRLLGDAHPHPPERLTFTGIIAESSNVGTIMATERVSDQGLYSMLKSFGFGGRTGSRAYGEEAGLLPRPETWSGSQRCTIAFGQGVSVTALQMASVYQTIANGGVRVPPRIVAGTVDGNRRFVPARAPKQTRVVGTRTAKDIALMLEAAVSAEGTGSLAAIDGYRVAGKTGTAQRYDESCRGYCGYTATFVGFTPADAPRLVALAVLQAPENGHFGGEIAAPVFKDVMTFALKTRKIPPTGTTPPSVRMSTDR
jgi:cell division protein FtsI (penicillin-binding protein 3)